MTHDPLRRERDSWSRHQLGRAVGEADHLLAREAEAHPDRTARIGEWRRRLRSVLPGPAAETVRVGVIGAVKSGKSTLINALLGQDVLPRGSGILTARMTEVVRADRPCIDLEWKTAAEANAEFSILLALLGRPGTWDFSVEEHRRTARELLTRAAPSLHPELSPLEAMLRGYPEVAPKLGRGPTRLDGREAAAGVELATGDETALFLRHLRVGAAVPDMPDGLCLLDCQGGDAWNVAHWHDLDEALLSCHALVYVVSSRVGLRTADYRLLETVGRYGLTDLTRVVLNQDLGEIREIGELRRVEEGVRSQLRGLGCAGEMASFSALHALLHARLLLDPDAVAANERRMMEIWDAAGGSLAAESLAAFQVFRAGLWEDVRAEGEQMLLSRGRVVLRRILVEAVEALHGEDGDETGLTRVVARTETTERMLAAVRDGLARAAGREQEHVAEVLARDFERRRGSQREAWETRVAALAVDTGAAAETAVLQRLWSQARASITATEPLRINAIRNLALESRGRLCREAEAIAAQLAEQLRQAGIGDLPPPSRAELSRGITTTRPIPLFRLTTAGAAREAPSDLGPAFAAGFRGVTRKLWAWMPRGGTAVATAGETVSRHYLIHHLRRAWASYVAEVREETLLPHIDEAVAQLYALLASWLVLKLGVPGDSEASILLDRLRELDENLLAGGPSAADDP